MSNDKGLLATGPMGYEWSSAYLRGKAARAAGSPLSSLGGEEWERGWLDGQDALRLKYMAAAKMQPYCDDLHTRQLSALAAQRDAAEGRVKELEARLAGQSEGLVLARARVDRLVDDLNALTTERNVLRDALAKFMDPQKIEAPREEPAFLRALRMGNKARVGVTTGPGDVG